MLHKPRVDETFVGGAELDMAALTPIARSGCKDRVVAGQVSQMERPQKAEW